jgi:hypothetical protein
MLAVRRSQPAFHPNAGFDAFSLDRRVFGVRRFTQNEEVYALTNVGDETVTLSLASLGSAPNLTDLLTRSVFRREAITLNPYQTLWLVNAN